MPSDAIILTMSLLVLSIIAIFFLWVMSVNSNRRARCIFDFKAGNFNFEHDFLSAEGCASERVCNTNSKPVFVYVENETVINVVVLKEGGGIFLLTYSLPSGQKEPAFLGISKISSRLFAVIVIENTSSTKNALTILDACNASVSV